MKRCALRSLNGLLTLVSLIALVLPSFALAQEGSAVATGLLHAGAAKGGGQGGVPDSRWEERRERYEGGPIRPGAQLDGRMSPWSWIGFAAFGVSYVLSIVVAIDDRGGAAIPLVGPWLTLTGAFGGEPLDGTETAAVVASGILQPAGLIAGVLGLLNPNIFIVYDAPLNSHSSFAMSNIRFVPAAPGADLGASLVMETF